MCKEFGWTVEYVLKMPARRFFAMRTETINYERKSRANFLLDLCDVAAIPLCNADYYKEVKSYFRDAAMDVAERKRVQRMNRHVFDADDPIDSKRAAEALKALIGGGGMVMSG